MDYYLTRRRLPAGRQGGHAKAAGFSMPGQLCMTEEGWRIVEEGKKEMEI
ncbi:MAG: hypothetical protein V1928_00785 [Parcubacteria group bacterium]